MNYFERIEKELADEIFEKLMAEESAQEELWNEFGEEHFDEYIEYLRYKSELIAKNQIKWAAAPKTILGLLGYYLDTRGVEYEKDGNGYRVWEEDGYSVYEMLFRVDEKDRKITLTHDMGIPVPEDGKWIVSRFLAKIYNNIYYNKEVKIEIHNGHVRWEASHMVRNEITNDSIPGDVMRSFTVSNMIDLLLESFQVVYPALMAVFYEGKNADEAVEIVMDELHSLS